MKTSYTVSTFLQRFWKFFVLIIVFAVLGGGFMGWKAKRAQHTTYTAKQAILISQNLDRAGTNNGQDSNLVSNELNMMSTYGTIVENESVASRARKLLPKKLAKKYSANAISEATVAKTKPDSLVLTVQVKSDSASDAVKLTRAVGKAATRELPTVQPGIGKITSLSTPSLANTTSSTTPSAKKRAMVGAVLGGLVGIIIGICDLTVRELLKK